MKFILDVHGERNITDFNMLKQQTGGVIFKCTEGKTFDDPLFNYRVKKCIEMGIPFSAYHFLRGTSSPEEQAEKFYSKISPYLNNFSIYPVLDIENPNPNSGEFIIDGCNVEELSNRFIHKFTELSHTTLMYYMSQNFINNCSEEFLFNKKLWIASYYGVNAPINPKRGIAVLHQYTDRENVDFVEGGCDYSVIISEKELYRSTPLIDPTPIPTPPLNNKILDLQRILNRLGYRDYNGNTLIEDGIFGEKTLSACPLLQIGDSGDLVKWVQLRVGASPDGIFGNDTKNSVMGFQQIMGLKIDGIVGKNTWRELCK